MSCPALECNNLLIFLARVLGRANHITILIFFPLHQPAQHPQEELEEELEKDRVQEAVRLKA